jgi:hypothetical protein
VQGDTLGARDVLPARAQAPDAARGYRVRTGLRADDSGEPVARLRTLRNLQRYDTSDYETLTLSALATARDVYGAVAASGRGDEEAARTARGTMRSRHGWSAWPAAMTCDLRLSAVSCLCDRPPVRSPAT